MQASQAGPVNSEWNPNGINPEQKAKWNATECNFSRRSYPRLLMMTLSVPLADPLPVTKKKQKSAHQHHPHLGLQSADVDRPSPTKRLGSIDRTT